MNHLLRELAPITPQAWRSIEEEARRTLKLKLAARKVVDFNGPLGWEASAVPSGRNQALPANPYAGVQASVRALQPLIELRIAFELQRAELEAAARGAKDPVLDPVREAAGSASLAEDRAVFHGFAAGGIHGIIERAGETLRLTDDYAAYAAVVAEAIDRLHSAGVNGPYAIALGPRCYTGLTKTVLDGFPVLEHVRRLVDGPIVWAPAVDGAVVLSMRGGDFELTVGEDWSIGYLEHSAESVRLYLQQTFTFRVLAAEAAVPLAYGKVAAAPGPET